MKSMKGIYLINGSRIYKVTDMSEVRIGRGTENNHLDVDNPRVSRIHCIFYNGLDGLRIEDNGSRNGTYVNGEPVKKVGLNHGDLITLAEVVNLKVDIREGLGGTIRGFLSDTWRRIRC